MKSDGYISLPNLNVVAWLFERLKQKKSHYIYSFSLQDTLDLYEYLYTPKMSHTPEELKRLFNSLGYNKETLKLYIKFLVRTQHQKKRALAYLDEKGFVTKTPIYVTGIHGRQVKDQKYTLKDEFINNFNEIEF